jgi:hypothetical protein
MKLDLWALVSGEIQFTEDVTAVVTLDRILTRGEETLFVLTTEYFHLTYSLRRCSRPQAVRCSTHTTWLSSGIVRGDGETFFGRVLLLHKYPKPKIKVQESCAKGVGRREETLRSFAIRLEQAPVNYKQNSRKSRRDTKVRHYLNKGKAQATRPGLKN